MTNSDMNGGTWTRKRGTDVTLDDDDAGPTPNLVTNRGNTSSLQSSCVSLAMSPILGSNNTHTTSSGAQPPVSASPPSVDGSVYSNGSSKEHVRRRVHDLIVERAAAKRLDN